jgi:hypothetical protein
MIQDKTALGLPGHIHELLPDLFIVFVVSQYRKLCLSENKNATRNVAIRCKMGLWRAKRACRAAKPRGNLFQFR